MPNVLHDHIKTGDEKRDECIEKVIKMFSLMAGEKQELAGYTALGRLFAIGYLKGLMESVNI